ncbi:MAG: M20 metallopeptidase family protein [Thermoanaerobaculia bacterium]
MIAPSLETALKSFPADELGSITAIRRDLHRHPELAFAETRTAGVIARELRSFGLSPRESVGKTGLLCDFGRSDPPRLMIRADMDGLPLNEESAVPYASEEAGRMHACGHDGHVAIGLAVARRLVGSPAGTGIRSLFQPAEEQGGGAHAMVGDGALEGVGAAIGIHLWNQLPVGKIGLVAGPQMAAVDEFEIVLSGPGGHGASPHETVDPIVGAARVVEGLQSVVAREVSPFDPAVVTVGSIHGGSAFNIIPREVRLLGTARSFSEEAFRSIPEKISRLAEGIAAAHGLSCRLEYRRINRATVNDRKTTAIVVEAVESVLGAGSIAEARTMGGEDMSVYLDRVPGCFFFVGSAPEGPHRAHHSPVFDFDERALAVGTLVLEAAARAVAQRLTGA